MRTLTITMTLTLVASLTGCASSPVKVTDPGPTITQTNRRGVQPEPQVRSFPVKNEPEPQRGLQAESPQSIWNDTIIQRVRVDAYVDENGNLFEPTYKNTIVRHGGWNLDAVRKKNGYIPPENMVKPYNMNGTYYSQSNVEVPQVTSHLELFNLDSGNVRLTGLVSQSDAEQAQSLAGEGEVAIFDKRVGWFIVKQAVMQGMLDSTNPVEGTNPNRVSGPKRPVVVEGTQTKPKQSNTNSNNPATKPDELLGDLR